MSRLHVVSGSCLAVALAMAGCTKEEKAPEQPVPLEDIRAAVRALEAKDGDATPARSGPLRSRELIDLLLDELGDDQRGAYAVAVRYEGGNHALEFREAEFTVRFAEARETEDALRVLIRNGEVVLRERVASADAQEVWGDNVLPARAIRTAGGHGLEHWWERDPRASLSAELVPRDGLRALRLPGRGRWVWRLALGGGEAPHRCTWYVEGGTLRFLRFVVSKRSEKGDAP